MMRLLMLVLTIAGFAMTFLAKGPGVLALGILFGFVGLFGLVFAIAAARVSATARPESLMEIPEDLAAMRARRAQQARATPTTAASAASAAKNPGPSNRGAVR